MKNPYPQDIFRWDNKESLDFTRGRFNQHCHEIWENCRKEVLEIIDELRGMVAEDGLRRLQGEETKLAWSDAFDFLYGNIRKKTAENTKRVIDSQEDELTPSGETGKRLSTGKQVSKQNPQPDIHTQNKELLNKDYDKQPTWEEIEGNDIGK